MPSMKAHEKPAWQKNEKRRKAAMAFLLRYDCCMNYML